MNDLYVFLNFESSLGHLKNKFSPENEWPFSEKFASPLFVLKKIQIFTRKRITFPFFFALKNLRVHSLSLKKTRNFHRKTNELSVLAGKISDKKSKFSPENEWPFRSSSLPKILRHNLKKRKKLSFSSQLHFNALKFLKFSLAKTNDLTHFFSTVQKPVPSYQPDCTGMNERKIRASLSLFSCPLGGHKFSSHQLSHKLTPPL